MARFSQPFGNNMPQEGECRSSFPFQPIYKKQKALLKSLGFLLSFIVGSGDILKVSSCRYEEEKEGRRHKRKFLHEGSRGEIHQWSFSVTVWLLNLLLNCSACFLYWIAPTKRLSAGSDPCIVLSDTACKCKLLVCCKTGRRKVDQCWK